MAMSSTCYNPFLYGLHNEAFQKEFVAMIPGITTKPSKNISSGRAY